MFFFLVLRRLCAFFYMYILLFISMLLCTLSLLCSGTGSFAFYENLNKNLIVQMVNGKKCIIHHMHNEYSVDFFDWYNWGGIFIFSLVVERIIVDKNYWRRGKRKYLWIFHLVFWLEWVMITRHEFTVIIMNICHTRQTICCFNEIDLVVRVLWNKWKLNHLAEFILLLYHHCQKESVPFGWKESVKIQKKSFRFIQSGSLCGPINAFLQKQYFYFYFPFFSLLFFFFFSNFCPVPSVFVQCVHYSHCWTSHMNYFYLVSYAHTHTLAECVKYSSLNAQMHTWPLWYILIEKFPTMDDGE